MQIFEEVIFFKLRTKNKQNKKRRRRKKKEKEKQTFNSTYLVSVGCLRLAEGKGHEIDVRSLKKRTSSENVVARSLKKRTSSKMLLYVS